MAWIEAHAELRGHPKLSGAAASLGIKPQQMLGTLFYFWWWAIDYAMDGFIENVDGSADKIIADACDWDGDEKRLVETLVSHRWLERTENGYEIHDWLEYCGLLVKRRLFNKNNKKRVANQIKSTLRRHRVDAVSTSRRQNVELQYSTQPNTTQHNPTQPNTTQPTIVASGSFLPPPPEVDDVEDVFLAYCESWEKNPKRYALTAERREWIKRAISLHGKDGAMIGVQNFREDDFEDRPKFNDLEYLFGGTKKEQQKRIDGWCQRRTLRNTKAFQRAAASHRDAADVAAVAIAMVKAERGER